MAGRSRPRAGRPRPAQPGRPGNKGIPPAVGAGLMKRLALHFVVAPTPEHHTSKTCVKCRGPCGAHPTLKTKTNREIRGLRVCQHEGCGLLQNRDRTGATNIGLQFRRLYEGMSPIRTVTDEDLEFHRRSLITQRAAEFTPQGLANAAWALGAPAVADPQLLEAVR